MHDLVLRGGRVLDGTGTPAVPADVAVDGGWITTVGRVDTPARRVLDAASAVVAPGFIDLHSHADYTVFGAPEAATQASQGVTTLVTGNCGFSPFPVVPEHSAALRRHAALGGTDLPWTWRTTGEFLAEVDRLPLGVNIACLVGHGALRIGVMGSADAPAGPAELARMRELLREALADGAVGLSSGLIYAPGSFARPGELVELCREVADAGKLYTSHIRDEGDGLLGAVAEALETAASAGARLEISHLKAIGPANWGNVARALERIETAARTLDVAADVYPYAASSTTLTSRLPGWALAGGVPELLRRLTDPATRKEIAADLDTRVGRTFLPEGVVIAALPDGPYAGFVGRSVADLAAHLGVGTGAAVCAVLREHEGRVAIINHAMDERDVRAALTHPLTAVASDGHVLAARPAGEKPHPRSFGTFTRVLGHYARDEGVLGLAEAVRKMTSLPAARLGWTHRGVLRSGAVADICVFDPALVRDHATYADPCRLSSGVRHTLLAGEPVLADGEQTDLRPGRVLRTS